MDNMQSGPFSHRSWFRFQPDPIPVAKRSADCVRMVNHVVCLVTKGSATLRSICRGRESKADVCPGTVHYRPADGEEYVIVGQPHAGDHSWFGLMIPVHHFAGISSTEGVSSTVEYREQLFRDDARLRSYLVRLAGASAASLGEDEEEKERIARLMVLRLTELSGGGVPDWRVDQSVFSAQTMRHLVDHIDAHLTVTPRLADLAIMTGLSPSHFAKKFRQSTGLSPHRFINWRRVQRSLDLLKTSSDSLAGVAVELGFSSQSHFTRLFSDLTGMTDKATPLL